MAASLGRNETGGPYRIEVLASEDGGAEAMIKQRSQQSHVSPPVVVELSSHGGDDHPQLRRSGVERGTVGHPASCGRTVGCMEVVVTPVGGSRHRVVKRWRAWDESSQKKRIGGEDLVVGVGNDDVAPRDLLPGLDPSEVKVARVDSGKLNLGEVLEDPVALYVGPKWDVLLVTRAEGEAHAMEDSVDPLLMCEVGQASAHFHKEALSGRSLEVQVSDKAQN